MTEFELIARFIAGAPREAHDLFCGAGDDCAVVAGPHGRDWLVTTDALVEGVHFRRGGTDLATLGRKALSVNVSDIAAMGGIPRFYLAAVGLPPGEAAEVGTELAAGMRAVAHEQGLILVGGDTVASPGGLMITVTAIGEAEHGAALLRSGAKPGDAVFVTGTFGAAALGLACLEAGREDATAAPFIARHRDPAARVAWGRFIARSGMATAMIDASDGLLADLAHIAEASNAGFEIDAAAVPRDPGFEALARELGRDPMELLLAGGEDYELVVTVAAARAAEFERAARTHVHGAIPVARIGTMVDEATARRVDGVDVTATGFDHFA